MNQIESFKDNIFSNIGVNRGFVMFIFGVFSSLANLILGIFW